MFVNAEANAKRRLFRHLGRILALCVPAAGLAQSTGYLALHGVRVWSLGDATRVAIELSGETSFRYDTLSNPERLFVDLTRSVPAAGQPRQQTIPVGDNLIRQIRIAQTQPGVMRVVLDLAEKLDYSISQLSNPYRVLIEVRRSAGTPQPELLEKIEREVRLETQSGRPSSPTPGSAAKPRPKPFQPPENPSVPPQRPTWVAEYGPPPAVPAGRPGERHSVERTFAVSKPVSTMDPATAPPGPSTSVPSPSKPEAVLARPARRTTAGAQSLTRALGLKLRRVVLDPGHGGHDTGTVGRSGLMEKDLVLDIAKRLGALLEERMGSEVIYTRDSDIFVPLEQRTQIANDHRADLFLSIHVNSSASRAVAGVETYFLSFTSSQADLAVAARENATSSQSIHELSDLVRKIAMNEKLEESRELATYLQASAHSLAEQVHGKALRNRGVKKAPFVVLIGAQMPSALVEIGFLSNARDEIHFMRDAHRQKIAEALYEGISRYAESLSGYQVAQSPSSASAKGQED